MYRKFSKITVVNIYIFNCLKVRIYLITVQNNSCFHRGQESAGIAMSAGDNHTHFNVKKGMGLISNIFNDDVVKKLKGNKCSYILKN